MPRTFSDHAIVLRAFNVGEADRFCILFTREHGRLAARARSVRRPGSRMGGVLLSLRYVHAEWGAFGNGYSISSASPADAAPVLDLKGFALAEEGMEHLLLLLEDEHPLEDLFDLSVEFLRLCVTPSRTLLLGYLLRMFKILGLLPESSNSELFGNLLPEERTFVERCTGPTPLASLPIIATRPLERLCRLLVADQTRAPLRAPDVTMALLPSWVDLGADPVRNAGR